MTLGAENILRAGVQRNSRVGPHEIYPVPITLFDMRDVVLVRPAVCRCVVMSMDSKHGTGMVLT